MQIRSTVTIIFADQKARYLISGSLAVAVLFLVLTILVEFARVPATIASVLSFGAAIIVNYSLQHRFVFNVERNHAVFFPRYVVVTLGTMALNTCLFWFLYEIVELAYLISQATTLMAIVPLNYVINRSFTFAHSAKAREMSIP